MAKGGIGVGSASILLVFAVLCLTIFSVITLRTATTDMAMTEFWKESVTAYYDADSLAESIVSEILGLEDIPTFVQGIDINTELINDTDGKMVSFSLPVSEQKELYVRLAIFSGFHETLEWKLRDACGWVVFDDGFDLWPGF